MNVIAQFSRVSNWSLANLFEAFRLVPEREVVDCTDSRSLLTLMGLAVFLNEERKHPTIARMEKQVSDVGCVKVRLA